MSYTRIEINEYGTKEVLTEVSLDSLPSPKAGEVRIKVLATCANFTDVMIRKGMYPEVREKFPFSLGYDMIGVIDKNGEGSVRFKEGQRVAELTVTGAYSEYLCLDESRLVPVPHDLDPQEAVCLILTYVTAYQMLHRVGKVKKGQRILIHGAGGAVGNALLQLGKLMDLEMYGTASPPHHERIIAMGATPIDYRSVNFATHLKNEVPQGFHAVFDAIGGDNFKKSFSVLRKGGILIAYGFYNAVKGKGGNIPLEFFTLLLWNLLPNSRSTKFYTIGSLRNKKAKWFEEDLSKLFTILSQGKIKPEIEKRMSLKDARLAHDYIERGGMKGKIVLIP